MEKIHTHGQNSEGKPAHFNELEKEQIVGNPKLHLYNLFSRIPGPRNFGLKVFTVSFLGTQLPLIALLIYVLINVELTVEVLTTFSIVLIASLLGSVSTMIVLLAYAEPVGVIGKAMKNFSEQQSLPDLPSQYTDEIGELMANTQSALMKLHTLMSDIHEVSISDELTGLYNRRFFMEQTRQLLSRAKRYEEPLTLIFADVDHFKKVNDTSSHQVGDETLKAIAKLLTRNARGSDLIARLGGDEFVIVFPQTTGSEAGSLCERLRRNIEQYEWSSISPGLKITASMGGAEMIKSDSIKNLMDRADAKLYKAKANGRNQVQM